MIDYQARQEAREAFIERIATRKRSEYHDGLVTRIELTWNGEPYKQLRIFRAHDGGWRMVSHRPYDRPLAGMVYEIEGQYERTTETRRQAITWIAIHWGDEVDRMMAREGSR